MDLHCAGFVVGSCLRRGYVIGNGDRFPRQRHFSVARNRLRFLGGFGDRFERMVLTVAGVGIWAVSLAIDTYMVPSDHGRVRVIARENKVFLEQRHHSRGDSLTMRVKLNQGTYQTGRILKCSR